MASLGGLRHPWLREYVLWRRIVDTPLLNESTRSYATRYRRPGLVASDLTFLRLGIEAYSNLKSRAKIGSGHPARIG